VTLVDHAYEAALRSGAVLGYSSFRKYDKWTYEASLFMAHINTLLAAAKTHGTDTCSTTLAELHKALPFFRMADLSHYLAHWEQADDGIVFTINKSPEKALENCPIELRYRRMDTKMPHMPINRAVRVGDLCNHGLDGAPILSYVATHAVRTKQTWIDMRHCGVLRDYCPPDIAALIHSGLLSKHWKHRFFMRVTESSRLSYPEVLWFATKRNTIDRWE
jgi:hypothetical protein